MAGASDAPRLNPPLFWGGFFGFFSIGLTTAASSPCKLSASRACDSNVILRRLYSSKSLFIHLILTSYLRLPSILFHFFAHVGKAGVLKMFSLRVARQWCRVQWWVTVCSLQVNTQVVSSESQVILSSILTESQVNPLINLSNSQLKSWGHELFCLSSRSSYCSCCPSHNSIHESCLSPWSSHWTFCPSFRLHESNQHKFVTAVSST